MIKEEEEAAFLAWKRTEFIYLSIHYRIKNSKHTSFRSQANNNNNNNNGDKADFSCSYYALIADRKIYIVIVIDIARI